MKHIVHIKTGIGPVITYYVLSIYSTYIKNLIESILFPSNLIFILHCRLLPEPSAGAACVSCHVAEVRFGLVFLDSVTGAPVGFKVCMYVCMHACMFVCLFVCLFVCMFVCLFETDYIQYIFHILHT